MEGDFADELVRAGYTLIETHISRVFLGDHDVYKLKRHVNLGFCDYSTPALREQACLAEVQLNRRLTSDVYHGVVALVRAPSGVLAFVPRERCAGLAVLEWAVHMRRLPDEDRADQLLLAGQLGRHEVEVLAASIAAFHRCARADASTAVFGSPEIIGQNVRENFAQVAPTIGSYLSSVERAALVGYQEAFLQRESERLLARVGEGFVRDGHGDLRLEHCYRTGSDLFAIIDCIEFNDRFRFADVAADLAFLAMDLRHHGRPDLAELFVAAYAQHAGDYGLYGVLDFYESYRATVRAKVSSMLGADPQVAQSTRERAQHEARRYYLHAIASGTKPVAPPRLYVMFGMIASGKSTLSYELAGQLGVAALCADLTRKELAGVPPQEPQHEAAFRGLYSEQMSEQVYDKLFERAGQILRSGRSVVLDATFRTRALRERARALAAACSAEVLFAECSCPRELALARLSAREQHASVSDGRVEIYDAFLARYEPTSELGPSEHVVVDTAEPEAVAVSKLLERAR